MVVIAQLGFKTDFQTHLPAYEVGGDGKLSIDPSLDKFVQAGAILAYGTYTCDIVSNAAFVKRDSLWGTDHCLLVSPYLDFKFGKRVDGRVGFSAPPLGNENLIRGIDVFNATSLNFSKIPFNALGGNVVIHLLDENLLNLVFGAYNLDATREVAPAGLLQLTHETSKRKFALAGMVGFNAPQLATNAVPTEQTDRVLFGLLNGVMIFKTDYGTSVTDLVFRQDENKDTWMKTSSFAVYEQFSVLGSVIHTRLKYLEAALRAQLLVQYTEPNASGPDAPVDTQGVVTGKVDLRLNAGFVRKIVGDKSTIEGLNDTCSEEGARCLRFTGFVEGSVGGNKTFGTAPADLSSQIYSLQVGVKANF